MRAARLLRILLLLQNRGRLTSVQLADELEVVPRTILRDVDAMTEAGLPVIVHQGNQGGIELGFNYRTRLTGLAQDEAEALGLILSASNPMLSALGLDQAAKQARAKLIESLPDKSRSYCEETMARFKVQSAQKAQDARVSALAKAVKAQTIARIRYASKTEQIIHPIGLELNGSTWSVRDDLSKTMIPEAEWGRLNMSALRFERLL